MFRLSLKLVIVTAAVAIGVTSIKAQTSPGVNLSGVVVDQTGSPIAAAGVYVYSKPKLLAHTLTGEHGEFTFQQLQSNALTVLVRARGFADQEWKWEASVAATAPLKIVLLPAPIAERVVVTATRSEESLADTAVSAAIVSSAEVESTAALSVDDILRQIPGFQLFRRTGSRSANPTSQGVSLRGVGASGASRAAVFRDGIPLNDPFGGWVYWSRMPSVAIEEVEVVRGASSSLYGSGALGGVVQVITRRPRQRFVTLETSFGNAGVRNGSLFLSESWRNWGLALTTELFKTAGYIPVAKNERGLIDTSATSRHSVLEATVERRFGDEGRLFANAAVFGESRLNGTPLQTNRTHSQHWSGGVDWHTAAAGTFWFRTYTARQIYDQNFTAINGTRSSEVMTRLQRVPARVVGFSGQWSQDFRTVRQKLVAGLETRATRGTSDEIAFSQNRASALISSGGRELTTGIFVEDILRLHPRLLLTAAVRFDKWTNYHGFLSNKPVLAAIETRFDFFDRRETAISPQASVLFRATPNLSFQASGYRGFRQPTLNELYRSFRVGDVLTLANENLRAERLAGGEAGMTIVFPSRSVRVRGSFYWTKISDPIANATLSISPSLITRQRQNLGSTRSRGFEIEAETQLSKHLKLSGGYLFVDARVLSFPNNPAVEGLLLPQVPRHQMTMQLLYTNARLLDLGVQMRGAGLQFDDDLNRLPLERYFQFDARVSRPLSPALKVFVAAENLFNSRYAIGRTPVLTVGPPALVRVGIKLHVPVLQ